MFQHGDSIGFIGETCIGETSYIGTESICIDGEIEIQDYNGECISGSKCCQSGEPGTSGGATCINIANGCNEWVDPS